MVGIGKKPSRIAEGGHIAAAGLGGAVTLESILDRAPE
jgi:hypothetical protein